MVHPFCMTLYPVCFLIAHNDLRFWANAPLPMAMILAFTALILLLMKRIHRQWDRAAIMTTGLVIVFFTACPIFDFLKTVLPYIGKDMVWGVFLFELIIVLKLFSVLAKKAAAQTQLFLNMISIVLLGMVFVQITTNVFERQGAQTAARSEQKNHLEQAPDIYLIVLDSYAGEEALRVHHGFDNSSFYEKMNQRGFTIVKDSRANYNQTQYAFPSLLNMQYIDEMFDKKELETLSANRLKRLTLSRLVQNKLMQFLRTRGYRSVHILNGWQNIGLLKADPDDVLMPSYNDGEFISILWNMTPLRMLTIDLYAAQQREETLRTLDILAALPKEYTDKPKFVCAHLFPPQQPYCFKPDGSHVKPPDMKQLTPEQENNYYLDQIQFINEAMLNLVDTIFRDSETEPVVIIMSDHASRLQGTGTDFMTNFINLIALSLPQDADRDLPSGIHNVNLFPLILNKLFETDFPIRENKYFSEPTEEVFED